MSNATELKLNLIIPPLGEWLSEIQSTGKCWPIAQPPQGPQYLWGKPIPGQTLFQRPTAETHEDLVPEVSHSDFLSRGWKILTAFTCLLYTSISTPGPGRATSSHPRTAQKFTTCFVDVAGLCFQIVVYTQLFPRAKRDRPELFAVVGFIIIIPLDFNFDRSLRSYRRAR